MHPRLHARFLATAFLALALSAGSLAPAAAQAGDPPGTDGTESLQAWLARIRRERETSRSALTTRVLELCRELEALASETGERKVEAARNALTALGPEAIPLLAPALEPGEGASAAARFRAEHVAITIAAARPTSIDAELAAHVRQGTPEARSNALLVLAHHGDPERALPLLTELYSSALGAQRGEVLAVIAELGGDQADRLVAEALDDPEPEVVSTALDALARARNESMSGAILEFVRASKAPAHVDGLLAYYSAVPAALDSEHALALVELARHVALSEKSKSQLLEALARFPIELDSRIEKALDSIADGGTREVRESALVLLAVLGDRNARKSLLKPYEDVVRRSPKWSQAYVQLADVLARIHDHRKAIGEYKTALELMSKEDRVEATPFLGIARCNALLGDYKEAAEYLEKAPVSAKTLRELAADPDFAAMAANPKYSKVFHLESGQ